MNGRLQIRDTQLLTSVDKPPVIVHTDGARVRCAPSVSGVLVACIVETWPHPRADLLWVADIDPGTGWLRRIVHGGCRQLYPDDLVPYAPPGAKVYKHGHLHSMRIRCYRGQRSEGMLCSTDELGWTINGPDEVHVLTDLTPGQPLIGES